MIIRLTKKELDQLVTNHFAGTRPIIHKDGARVKYIKSSEERGEPIPTFTESGMSIGDAIPVRTRDEEIAAPFDALILEI